MRTIAWETAFQIALKNCSDKERGGQYIRDFGSGKIHTVKHIFFQKISPSLM